MELLRASLEPVNLPLTILLTLMLAYWIMVIFGALDISLFDVDLDLDLSANFGFFDSLLAFVNVNRLPVMVVMTVLTVSVWTISVLSNFYLHNSSAMVALGLLVPNLLVSLVITKVATKPFSFVFGQLERQTPQVKTIGSLTTLLSDASEDRITQAEVETGGAALSLLVRTRDGVTIAKGAKALVVEKEEDRDVYIVEPFDDWE